jgi:hypothetical protein
MVSSARICARRAIAGSTAFAADGRRGARTENARGWVHTTAVGLVYFEDFYFKCEGRVRRYAPRWKASGPVGVFWGAHQRCDFALAHGHATLVPSPYDLSGAEQSVMAEVKIA